MNKLDLLAQMKPTAEFIAAAAQSDVTQPLDGGKTLLRYALANTDLESRYASTQWLLDRGCPLGAPNSEGHTELHVLFAHVKHDIPRDLELAEQLIALGADVNARSSREGLVFCSVLRMKYRDEDLEPLYSLWFSQPVALDFESESAAGVSPLSYARKVPFRAGILKRMEEYVESH